MDMYTFTYSDDYDIPDIHGWNYYIMDDFFSIIYIIHGTWNCYVLHVLLAKSSLPMVFRWHMTVRCYGFLWPTHFCG